MNPASEKRLSKLMPAFAAKVRTLIENLHQRGFEVEITQGLRTFEEQSALYAQGRTRKGPKVTNAKAGQSLHNYGLAVDFALFTDGKYSWPEPHDVWLAIGQEAVKLGLEAGYFWPKPDKPHVEWAKVGWRDLLAWYNEGGLAKVWREVP